jgi:hypothetical protein
MPSKQPTPNLTDFNRTLSELIATVPESCDALLRHQAALLVEELVKKSLPADRSKAERNIMATVRAAFRPTSGGRSDVDWRRYSFVRRSTGIRKTGRPVNLTPAAYRAFLRSRKEHIGILAAGWLAKGNPLRVRAPKVALRNVSHGTIEFIRSPLFRGIRSENLVRFARRAFGGRYPVIVQAAIDTRNRMMKAQLKRWLSSGKVQYRLPDWVRGNA